jgi:hypothetical protein
MIVNAKIANLENVWPHKAVGEASRPSATLAGL